jgi:hypothetical protein
MPDFNTRTPEEAGQDSAVTRGRGASIINKVRTSLMANKLRALLVAGGVLLVVVVSVSLGLHDRFSSEPSDHDQPSMGGRINYVTCEGSTWSENAECVPPGSRPDGIVRCRAPTREVVTRTGRCRGGEWIEPYQGGG